MASYESLLNRAQGVAGTPYTPYGGELVAPVNSQQNLGISGINQNASYALPYIQQAAGMATNAAAPISAADIQRYESPFTQDVVNATQAQFANQNQQQMQGVRGNAIAQGALGGNREAVAEAETANQQQLAQAPVIAGLMNQGYTTGLNTALTEQQALASGANQLGNLGVAGQGAALSGAGAQVGAGSLQQGTQQALDQALLQQFMTQQAYPFQTTQWLAGLDSGIGSQMGGTGTSTAPAPSTLGQIAGLGTAGVGLLGGTGAFGSAGWLAPAMMALASGGAVRSSGVAPDPHATVPESHATLVAQQKQLVAGHRRVQMFPHGTSELSVPHGMHRIEAHSGVFHYNPNKVDSNHIRLLAARGHEHELLDLGPVSKDEVIARMHRGELPVAVVERQPDGTEVRAAAGTHGTALHQAAAMHRTKSPGNNISFEDPRTVLAHRRQRAWGGRIQGFDAGGGVPDGVAPSPYGMSAMPFSGAHGFVPGGGNIAHGRGAPPPPSGGQPQDQAAQLGQQIGSMAKAISGGMQRQGVNPVVPGAGNVTGLNYGPNGAPISTPTFGVDGPVGEASGGRVGYASGGVANIPMPRGYDDGGFVEDMPDVAAPNFDLGQPASDTFADRFGQPPMPSPDMPLPVSPGVAPSAGEMRKWFGGNPPPKSDTFASRSDLGLPDNGGVGLAASTPLDASIPAPTGVSARPSFMAGVNPTGGISGSSGDLPLTKGIEPVAGVAGAWAGPDVAAPPLEDKGIVGTPAGGPSGAPPTGVAGIPSSFVSQVQRSEGFTPKATWDYKQYTNGYGTKARYPGEVISEPEARKRFDSEFGSAAKIVDNVNPNLDPGTRAALTSLTFNAGDSWTHGKLGEQIRSGDLEGARQTFLQYNKADGHTLSGLADRRQREAQWFGGEAPAGGEGVAHVASAPHESSDLPPNSRPASDVAGVVAPGVAPSNSGIDWSGSGKLWPALAAAGFGMMASKSPFPGVAVGEGGLQGMGAYAHAAELEQQHALKKSQIDLEVKKLAQQADLAQQHLAQTDKHHDTMSAYQKAEMEQRKEYQKGVLDRENFKPSGMATEDGHPILFDARGGRSIDAITMQPLTGNEKVVPASKPGQTSGMSDEAIKTQVESYKAGNTGVIAQIARGINGPQNLEKFWNSLATDLSASGMNGRDLAVAKANFAAQSAAARSSAVRESNIMTSVEEAKNTFPMALKASEAVPRTSFVPLNRAIQMVQSGTSSPELARFVTANQAVITAYGQAMSRTGTNTVHAQQSAEKLLSTATSPEAYRTVIDQLGQEMEAAKVAPGTVNAAVLGRIGMKPRMEAEPTGAAPAGAPTAAPAAGGKIKIQNGWQYQEQPDGSYKAIGRAP